MIVDSLLFCCVDSAVSIATVEPAKGAMLFKVCPSAVQLVGPCEARVTGLTQVVCQGVQQLCLSVSLSIPTQEVLCLPFQLRDRCLSRKQNHHKFLHLLRAFVCTSTSQSTYRPSICPLRLAPSRAKVQFHSIGSASSLCCM